MFIAFEGPDNTGKSTLARELDCAEQPGYNMTQASHAEDIADWNGDGVTDLMPHSYDRIDWFSHMVYRLALTGHEWHDERARTVFAMPSAHLVILLHRPDIAATVTDGMAHADIGQSAGPDYGEGDIGLVNSTYFYFANFFTGLNEERDYELFRTVSLVEIVNSEAEPWSMRLASFSSPVTTWDPEASPPITSSETLLKLLQHDEQHRL